MSQWAQVPDEVGVVSDDKPWKVEYNAGGRCCTALFTGPGSKDMAEEFAAKTYGVAFQSGAVQGSPSASVQARQLASDLDFISDACGWMTMEERKAVVEAVARRHMDSHT